MNVLEKEKETTIKCFHKAADSKFDDAFTRTRCLFLLVFFYFIYISGWQI